MVTDDVNDGWFTNGTVKFGLTNGADEISGRLPDKRQDADADGADACIKLKR